MAEAEALGGDAVVRIVEDIWESRMDRLEATFARVAIQTAKIDKTMAEICDLMRSFSRNERCDVSDLIAKMDSTDSTAAADTNNKLIAKNESRDSLTEIDSDEEFKADSVHQLEEFENKVSISSLEPSHIVRVEEMKTILLKNGDLRACSDILVDDMCCGNRSDDWIFPKVEQVYDPDVELGDESLQKSVDAKIELVAHHLFDQRSLVDSSKMNQREYQKDWTFKYKVKTFVTGKREQPQAKQEKHVGTWGMDCS